MTKIAVNGLSPLRPEAPALHGIGARLAWRLFERFLIRPGKAAYMAEADAHRDFANGSAVMLAFKATTRNIKPYPPEIILDRDAKAGLEAFGQRCGRNPSDSGKTVRRAIGA